MVMEDGDEEDEGDSGLRDFVGWFLGKQRREARDCA